MDDLMDDHEVDDLHVLCIKRKNLTELVQGILVIKDICFYLLSL